MLKVPADVEAGFDARLQRSVEVGRQDWPDYRKWLRFWTSAGSTDSMRMRREACLVSGQAGFERAIAGTAGTGGESRRAVLRVGRQSADDRSTGAGRAHGSTPEPGAARPPMVPGQASVSGTLTRARTGPAQAPYAAGPGPARLLPCRRRPAPRRGQFEAMKNHAAMRNYSPKTWATYRGWTQKFQTFVRSKPPELLNTEDVKAFLTDLAVRQRVAASTQNQAFNALLFFFRHGLGKEFGKVEGVVRAKRRPYVPVVLSRPEVDAVIRALDEPFRLIVTLLYGCGLRISECLGLRVHCLNLDVMLLTVHDGKGQKDRTVLLAQLRVGGRANAARGCSSAPSGGSGVRIWGSSCRASWNGNTGMRPGNSSGSGCSRPLA